MTTDTDTDTDTETLRKKIAQLDNEDLQDKGAYEHGFSSGVQAALRILDALTPSPEAQPTKRRKASCDICGSDFKEFAGDSGRCCNNHVISDTWEYLPAPQPEAPAAQEQLKVMREALEWYGEEVFTYAITQAKEPRSAAHADKGKIARDALAKAAALASVTAAQEDGNAD